MPPPTPCGSCSGSYPARTASATPTRRGSSGPAGTRRPSAPPTSRRPSRPRCTRTRGPTRPSARSCWRRPRSRTPRRTGRWAPTGRACRSTRRAGTRCTAPPPPAGCGCCTCQAGRGATWQQRCRRGSSGRAGTRAALQSQPSSSRRRGTGCTSPCLSHWCTYPRRSSPARHCRRRRTCPRGTARWGTRCRAGTGSPASRGTAAR